MRETIAMREIIANAEGVREVKAKCVSLPQNAGDLATLLLWEYLCLFFVADLYFSQKDITKTQKLP